VKHYPEYKDSNAEWLGEVPEHWEVVPNRALFDEIKDRDCPDEQMLSVTIKRGVIRQAALLEDSSNKDSSNLDRSNYKLVQPGDIAYNKMRAWQGALGVSEYRGIISPAYVVQRPRYRANPEYFHRLLRTPAFAKEAERWSYGITSDMWSLRPEHFKLIYSCLPPLAEQAAIARYLDYMDRRVRRLVRAKRKLIKLLEEQKQAIIHRAVTRGLDPDVPLKPSGVEWLGDIPQHWEVWQLGHFCRIGNGSTPSRGNTSYWSDGHYPWLNSSYANEDAITQADQFVTAVALEECHLPIVPSGSLLVAITGQGKTRGKAAMLSMEATINQHLAYVTPKAAIASGRYLQRVFDGAYSHLRSISDDSGSTKGALTCGDLKHFRIALPEVPEQVAIVDHLDQATGDIDATIDRARREIELLQEYRTRLIADVVTGKLNVREAAADLPDEPDESEPLDEADDLMDGEDALADDGELDGILKGAET
jgi:type I restriction enzyme, S subunit